MRRLIDRERLGLFSDLTDVHEMFTRGLIDGTRLLAFFEEIEPHLYRYPAIDPKRFRRAVAETLAAHSDLS